MKCSNCETEFEDGIFCPECGKKCEETLPDFSIEVKKEGEEVEELTKERVADERLEKEKEKVERLEKEKENLERQVKEKAESLEKEKMENERLAQENLKRDMDMRTVRGTVYKTLDEAELAKEEHNKIDVLKSQLLNTKSQKKRQKIFSDFTETITTIDAKNRYEMLKEKISRKVPVSELINRIYGITLLFALFAVIIGSILVGVDKSIFLMICATWAGFGIWIWPIWKTVVRILVPLKNTELL